MSTCRSCNAEIIWCTTTEGNAAPFDAEPDPDGLWVIEGHRVYLAGMLDPGGPRYTSHFATCPHADEHRKPRSTTPLAEPDLASYPVVDHPVDHIGPPDGLTIEESFWQFHGANPHVYDELVLLARRARRRGIERVGMKMLFEVLRWRVLLRTSGDEFKLNNNYTSYYARLVMLREPDLVGAFETRRLHVPDAGPDD